MDESLSAAPASPGFDAAPVATLSSPPATVFAALQAIAVCGIPTQVVVATVLILGTGMAPLTPDGLSLEFVATVSFIDTALVAILIRIFLMASGENSRDVYLGHRRPSGEIWRGLALVPVAFLSLIHISEPTRPY